MVFEVKTLFLFVLHRIAFYPAKDVINVIITLDLRGESVDRSTSSVWTTPPTKKLRTDQ